MFHRDSVTLTPWPLLFYPEGIRWLKQGQSYSWILTLIFNQSGVAQGEATRALSQEFRSRTKKVSYPHTEYWRAEVRSLKVKKVGERWTWVEMSLSWKNCISMLGLEWIGSSGLLKNETVSIIKCSKCSKACILWLMCVSEEGWYTVGQWFSKCGPGDPGRGWCWDYSVRGSTESKLFS